jgi:hypothetical protein
MTTAAVRKELRAAISRWQFGYVGPNVNGLLKHVDSPLPQRRNPVLYTFDRFMGDYEILAAIRAGGHEPANLLELLSWTDWDSGDWVVAMGTALPIGDGTSHLFVPYVSKDYHLLSLDVDLLYRDWPPGVRYLAVEEDARA